MISLFRETTIGYIASVFVIVVGFIVFVRQSSSSTMIILLTLLGLFLIFLSGKILLTIALKKIGRIEKLLTDDCNAKAYAEIFEKFAKLRQFGSMKNYVFLSLANAHLHLGNYQEAISALGRAGKIPNNKLKLPHQFLYHRLLFSYSLRALGDISLAKDELDEMHRILMHPKWKEKQKKQPEKVFAIAECLLRMEQGDYDGCEAVFKQAEETAETLLEKVSAKFNLGRIFLHDDRVDEAVEAFTFVALNGGNLLIQQLAMQQLELFEQTIEIPLTQQCEIYTPNILTPRTELIFYICLSIFLLLSFIIMTTIF